MTSNEGATEGCSCGLGADGLNESYPRYREAKAFHPSTSVNQPCLRTRVAGNIICLLYLLPMHATKFCRRKSRRWRGRMVERGGYIIIIFQLACQH